MSLRYEENTQLEAQVADQGQRATDQWRWNATEVDTQRTSWAGGTNLRSSRPSSSNYLPQKNDTAFVEKGEQGAEGTRKGDGDL